MVRINILDVFLCEGTAALSILCLQTTKRPSAAAFPVKRKSLGETRSGPLAFFPFFSW